MRLPTDEHQLKVGIKWLTNSAIYSVTTTFNTAILATTTPTLTVGAMILQYVNLVIAWWNVQFQKESQPSSESVQNKGSILVSNLAETTKDYQASPIDDILIE